jgi:hypothetical protein
MRRAPGIAATALLAAAVLAGCAVAPRTRAEDASAPVDQAREVRWDDAVAADFEKDVPKFVKRLAKAKIEEMARVKGTYFVDRALYDEAMAANKR